MLDAVLGLEDLEKSVTQTAVRDELTYTSNEGSPSTEGETTIDAHGLSRHLHSCIGHE
jgi:hypothetical protein